MSALKWLILLVLFVLTAVLVWNSGNYSEEYSTGSYRGIAIGDTKQAVAKFLKANRIDDYAVITLEGANGFHVEEISSGSGKEESGLTLGCSAKSTRALFLDE